MSAPLYLVLLHYPVSNRKGETITTSVTNLDIHDLSRTALTYGMKKYFIVTPLKEQHELVQRILDHWKKPGCRESHPDRAQALSIVRLKRDFSEVKAEIEAECGKAPVVALTDARPKPNTVLFEEARQRLKMDPEQPVVVVLGTGWGLLDEFYEEADWVLPPLYGPGGAGGYNHLSVRAAGAAILDRLLGQ